MRRKENEMGDMIRYKGTIDAERHRQMGAGIIKVFGKFDASPEEALSTLMDTLSFCEKKFGKLIYAKDTPFKEDLRRLLEYNADERKHWEESGEREDHIYCSMQRLAKTMDFSDAIEETGKVWIVLGLMGGLPAEDPKLFFHEAEAKEASAAMDEELGIVRDENGEYEDENDSYLYEIEIGKGE